MGRPRRIINGRSFGPILFTIVLCAGAAVCIGWLITNKVPTPSAGEGRLDNDRASAGASDEIARFEPAFVDFGTVAPNAEAVAIVQLENLSGDTLKLVNLQTTCGCLIADPASPAIEPGEQIDVAIRMETSAREDQQVAYRVTAYFENVGVGATLFVRAKTAHVFDFDLVSDPPPGEHRVSVRSVDDRPFRIVATPWFVTGTDPAPDVESNYFELIVDSNATPVDEDDPEVRLALSHPLYRTVVIDWRTEPGTGNGSVAAPRAPVPQVMPLPMEFIVPGPAAAAGAEIEVELLGLRAEDEQRLTVRSDDMTIEVREVTATASGLRYRLMVRANGETWAGGTVFFDCDGQPACTIRIRSD